MDSKNTEAEGKTILLICDFQEGTLSIWKEDPEWKERTLANLRSLLSSVRSTTMYKERNLLIGFVGIAFSPGYPEIGPNSHHIFQFFLKSGILLRGNPDVEFVPAPDIADDDSWPREFILYKTRGSAFHDTRLDTIIRAQNVERIVICGLATSGVVLSTVRQAADLDYDVIVLEDCCGDLSKERHTAAIEHIFPMQTTVTQSKEWVADLK
ncbi:uncharacterized protein SPPG_06567 [Spizellomyces punctatus DAOM BR117]|uniref:Isochorismatase-like domain-containing protein n=1 Tax=Spizellomyces punctatus (strain DAOM BR117) TaxID=645134 RepID=A0A0L0HBQ5_SPIPD|nr:uncharacterized protein SPPG_06567 [Spizellomyces punctatus DAOM BR117]KNC98163.1 hypothetical protein SPPG_06567 [Spizellomyces punctatus DAOM BR117]|eukprot:XP_016606203.1 hypothetical protein SPPG_06567 [Spizellomyces punctatus DAOM BR117]